jgi:uncharacterized membrane protein
MIKSALLFWFLIGCLAGVRALMAPALVCWAAHFGWVNLEGTGFAFMASKVTLIIFSLLALVELTTDKLPKTPARTSLPQLFARVLFGGLAGAALAAGSGGSPIIGAVIAAIGAVIGAFAGYHIRHALVTQVHLPDLAVALLEDFMAISGGLFIVSRM